MSSLTFPEEPDEYFTYGWYVQPYPQGHGWKFGLPATPSSTSNTCGALPFRSGTGLCSPYCLRGEDWVFMAEWAGDRYNLPNIQVLDPVQNLQGPYNVMANGPERQQLQSMYNSLVELKTVYGQDFTLTNQEVQYNDVNSTVLAALDRNYSLTSQQPPSQGNVPLQLSRIQNYFTDMAKMKVTVGSAGLTWASGSGRTLYSWSENYGQDPQEIENYVTSMYIRNVSGNINTSRPMEFDAQFFGLFLAHQVEEDSGGTVTTDDFKWYLYKLDNKTTITQNMNAQYDSDRFVLSCHIGGASFASSIASLLNMNHQPHPVSGGRAYFYTDLNSIFVALWPKYLQL